MLPLSLRRKSMKMPLIVSQTYQSNINNPEMEQIVRLVNEGLKDLVDPILRARFVHDVVDMFNQAVFAHPLVKELSPCHKGCSACCHSQVSVTEEEAKLLAQRIATGVEIDIDQLLRQARCEDHAGKFLKLTFNEKKCIFLDQSGGCQVYNDRPSVCRTNAVVGSASQCFNNIENKGKVQLVKTPNADMAIAASYLASPNSGTLAHLVFKELLKIKNFSKNKALKSILAAKMIFKDQSL